MHFLYPSDPFNSSKPDEAYSAEFDEMLKAGHICHVFSAEDVELGQFKAKPALMKVSNDWLL